MDNRVVNLDGKVYSIAGGNGSASTANSYVYDPASLAWTAIAPLPGARNAVTVGAVSGKIIASSGWAAAGPDAATWIYDPAGNAWTSVAANPAPRAAAGQAVADGKLYAVGGCTTSGCLPMCNTWSGTTRRPNAGRQLADYPKSVAFASCGAIDGKVYCAGGNDGSGTAERLRLRPGSRLLDRRRGRPGRPLGGVVRRRRRQAASSRRRPGRCSPTPAFAYDPAAGRWTALPNANPPRTAAALACGFYKVGGSSGGFTATVDSEALPGFEDCAASADVEWMSIDKTAATWHPGES